jgi:hypothetical protein
LRGDLVKTTSAEERTLFASLAIFPVATAFLFFLAAHGDDLRFFEGGSKDLRNQLKIAS